METKYFHELDKSEILNLVENKTTWDDIVEKYRQPDWCNYPNALNGFVGCWSLTDIDSRTNNRCKISEEYCKSCDEYK